MLTIKHILPSGHENVFQVKSATYNPANSGEVTNMSASVLYDDGTGHCDAMFEGIVYVMNSDGKTVAKWCLTAVPIVPQ